jgi:hypothetical protein
MTASPRHLLQAGRSSGDVDCDEVVALPLDAARDDADPVDRTENEVADGGRRV